MAKTVATVLSASEIDDYGNIILNGYATTGPNTANIKAWQYAETTTAPVNLPSITTYQPMLRGWTTNYMSYFTRPEMPYGNAPGQENPFLFDIWNFYQNPGPIGATGPAATISGSGPGGDPYVPGVYTLAAVGGSGSGMIAQVTVSSVPSPGLGAITGLVVVDGGEGYAVGDFPIEFPGIPYDPAIVLNPTEKITVDAIASSQVIPAAGFSPCPRRLWQNQTSQVTLPQNQNNSEVIPYSFLYPIQTSQTAPPLDYVAP